MKNIIIFLLVINAMAISDAQSYAVNSKLEVTGTNVSEETNSLAASFLSEGMLIGPNGSRDYGKAVKFTLSNTGGSIVVVNKIYAQIIEAKPLREYTFPRGPLAPLIEYSYDIEFKADSKIVPITENIYSYKNGDIDVFSVHIKSKDKYLFKFKIVVEGYDSDKPKEKYIQETGVYQIAFPEMVTYESLVNSAKQSVDIFLEGGAAQELILNCRQKLLSNNIRVRIIVDRDFYYRSGEFDRFLMEGIDTKLVNSSRFIVESGYRLFSNIPRRSMNKGYIILDDKAVLTNETKYLLGNVSYIENNLQVKEYRAHFNSFWKKDPFLDENVYRKVFAPQIDNVFKQTKPSLTVSKVSGRLDEYIYLLRFEVMSPNS